MRRVGNVGGEAHPAHHGEDGVVWRGIGFGGDRGQGDLETMC